MGNDIMIKVGEYEVLNSGTIITHANKSVEFEIKMLRVRIQFEKDTENKTHKVNSSIIDNGTCFQITLINFDNSLGTGLTVPIEIGTINGEKIYLQFIVYALTEAGTKMLSYTWLTKKEG